MNQVIVLYEGFSRVVNDTTMSANCSCILIKTLEKNIIFDTMTAWDKHKILSALNDHQIEQKDINYVICSHSHADHIGNNNLFVDAEEHIVGITTHCGSMFVERNIRDCDYEICKGVVVTSTPGHTAEDISVILIGNLDGNEATIGITGDLFEKKEDIEDPSIWMNLGAPELKETQAASRLKVANSVDYIIPGHGPFFRVSDEVRLKLKKQLEMIKSKQL